MGEYCRIVVEGEVVEHGALWLCLIGVSCCIFV